MNRRLLALGALSMALVVGLVAASGALGLPALPGQSPTTEDPAADGTTTTTPDDPNGTRLLPGGETLTLEAASGQVVRGETDLPAGTELSVRLRSAGENPFLRSTTATVAENGTFRATFDLSDVPAGTTFEASVRRGDEQVANASGTVVAGEPGTDGDGDDGDAAASLVFEGENLTLEAASGQVVRGETDLPAGTELSVQLRSTGGNPFVASATATVRDDGTFRATFDLSDVPAGATFTVSVRHDGERLVEATGETAD